MDFRETLEHRNAVFNDNGTVTAFLHHPLTYVPEMSNGTEEDIMILPNIALLVSVMWIIFLPRLAVTLNCRWKIRV